MNRVPILMKNSMDIESSPTGSYSFHIITMNNFVNQKWLQMLPLYRYIVIKSIRLTFSDPRIYLVDADEHPTQLSAGAAESLYVCVDRDHEFALFQDDDVLRSSPQTKRLRTNNNKPCKFSISFPKVTNQAMLTSDFITAITQKVQLPNFLQTYTGMANFRVPQRWLMCLSNIGDYKNVRYRCNVSYNISARLCGFAEQVIPKPLELSKEDIVAPEGAEANA